ncbi:MAG: glycosyltransferase family 2 protein [Solirubrobacteraceae bacterium]
MDALRWRDEQRGLREVVRRERRTSDGHAPLEAAPVAGNPVAGDTPDDALATVIVVCWNSQEVLARCLDHLFAQDYVNREIIVVDDGSDDATGRVGQEAANRGEMKLVRSTRNRGCPSARNLGLQHAAGEIVAFIDADGFARPSWLSEVVAAFGDDAQIGGVASTVFFDDNPMVLNGAGGIVNRQGWAADLSMNRSYEDARIAKEALYPMGCGMAVRRDALERVGRFDERMLNYYDDVDYGMRLWRAGYRVVVAADAWIDHGTAAGDSARKRLWCERHRMRVALKHTPLSELTTWVRWEARGLRSASTAGRTQKLRSIGWNLRRLPSTIARRRDLRGMPGPPVDLVDASHGDGFPVGMTLRGRPMPERADASLDMSLPEAEQQLLHGWFPTEQRGQRSYRWAAKSAAALFELDAPAKRMRLDYAHVPVEREGIDVRIRRVGSSQPLASVWETHLGWQYLSRSVENHPLELAAGTYEVCFVAARGWSDPPRDTRSLAFALSSISFAGRLELPRDGLDMSSTQAEDQLVSGWFEAEDGPLGAYRWSARRATVLLRAGSPVASLTLAYRLAPGSIGRLRLALTPLDAAQETWSTQLPWRDSDWREDTFAAELAPGDYLLSFDADRTWSNPLGGDSRLPPENRSLGVAVASVSFGTASLR